MGWQTVRNSVDCSIFLMRHMETYTGHLLNWKVGLCIKNHNEEEPLNKLWTIYYYRILNLENNNKKDLVLEGATKFAQEILWLDEGFSLNNLLICLFIWMFYEIFAELSEEVI